GQFNSFGQRLFVDDSENIIAEYSFKHDRRPDKEKILPQTLKLEKPVPIAQWSRDKIKKKLEKKFAQKGFFICLQNKDGVFNEIRFGGPLFFDDWIKCVKTGDVFFDPGMYQGNMRPYSQWRAGSNFWMKLLEPV
ncbi:MAG: LlaMI family restriction endonuclease, partial [Proteobacteria bacterium]|nr:LlaMI family restriction endonuclease [Pseudomonadota bacterium]